MKIKLKIPNNDKPGSMFNNPIYKKKPVKQVNKSDKKTLMIISDVHVPENDPRATDVFFQILEKVQPEMLLINGDFLELKSCSMHGGEVDVPKLSKELAAGQAFIEKIVETVPDIELFFNEGNHETRAERKISNDAPAFEGIFSIGEFFKEMGVTYLSEWEQPFEYGKFLAIHGHQLGKGFPRFHASKLTDVYGIPGATVLMGHTHKGQTIEKNTVKGNIKGIGLGCLRTLDPKWLRGEKAGWKHQIAVVTFVGEEPFTEIVDILDGVAAFRGDVYTATV